MATDEHAYRRRLKSARHCSARHVKASEAVCLVREHVAQNNRLPVQVALLTHEVAGMTELAPLSVWLMLIQTNAVVYHLMTYKIDFDDAAFTQ